MAGKINFGHQHSYDYFYDKVKDKTFFTQSAWEKAANTGTLDSYIVELNELENKVNIEDFMKEYNTDYLTEDQIRMAMQNEVYKDELAKMVKKDAIRYKSDEEGNTILENGQPIEEKYETNMYDYNKTLLQGQAEYKHQQYYNQVIKDYKESLSPFAKWLAGAMLNMGQFGIAAVKQFEGMLSYLYGYGGGAIEAIKEGKNYRDTVAERMASDDARFITKHYLDPSAKELGYDTIEEAVFEVERMMTDNRDLDGNYSNWWEELTASLWQTAGQMVPSMILGSAIGGVTGAGKKGTEWISKGLFYSGVAANDVKETYNYFAENNVSVPSRAILSNSNIKAALQLGLESLLDLIPFFGVKGPTTLDVLTKNAVGEGVVGSGVKKVARDFFKEGLEEVLQDMSDYGVNKLYSFLIEENFGQLSELSFYDISLAFVAGALMSLGANGIEIMMGQNVPTDILDVKEGQIPVVNDDGTIVDKVTGKKIEYKKLGKIASWNYNMNLRSYIESLNKLTELDTKYRNKAFAPGTKAHNEYVQAVSNAYQSVRILASIYKSVGQEEFEKAMNLLDTMNKNMMRGSFVSGYGELVKDNFAKALSGLSAKSKAKLIDKLVQAHMDNIEKIVDIDNVDTIEVSDDTRRKLKDLLNTNKKIYITGRGSKAVKDYDSNELFVPSNQLENNSVDAITQQANEDFIVDYINDNPQEFGISTEFLNNIIDLFKNRYGENVDKKRVLFQFLYDDGFRDVVVRTEKDGYKILENVVKNLSKIETPTDDKLISKKLNIVKQLCKITMINYIIDYPTIQSSIDLTIFDDAERNHIKENTTSMINCSKYVETSEITSDYKNVLIKRINQAILTVEQKDVLKSILDNKNSTKEQRDFLINILDERYNYYFKGKNNNVIYLKENGDFKKVLFNNFLQANDLTLKDFTDDNLYEISQRFKVFSGNMFDFELTSDPNNPIVIYYAGKRRNRTSDFQSYKNDKRDATIIVLSENKNIVNRFASSEYKNLTINDLIMNKDFLNDVTKNKILKMYKLKSYDDITLEHTVNYLNTVLKDDDIQVSLDNQGNFCLVDLYEYRKVFTKTNFSIDYLKRELGGFTESEEGTRRTASKKLSSLKLIKEDFLQHFDNGAKIMVVEKDTNVRGRYDAKTNTIIIFENEKTKNQNMFLVFAHEFQHLISYHNSLSHGSGIFLDRLSPKDAVNLIKLLQREKLISKEKYTDKELEDEIINNSYEQLEKSKDNSVKQYIASVFYNLYRSIQGEVDANSLVNTMLPFNLYIDVDNGRTYINTPFGESFELGEDRFPNSSEVKVQGNNSQLVSYDIPSPDKPLSERQKKIQENKLKKPIEYKPGKFKIAKLDENGNIVRNEKGGIEYNYPSNYGTRYVGKKESAGTNLEKYGYVTKELQNDFKSFIVNATPDIDKDIWNKLIEGKLNRNYVLRKFKEVNLDAKTFELINDCFFKNTEIKTQDELDTYVELTPEYAALYYALKKTDLLEKYGDKINKDNIRQVIDIISRDEVLSKMYMEYEENFNKSWGKELNIDKGLLRLNWMSMFDGTIHTAGHIANIARKTAIQTYFIVNKEVSLDSKIGGTDLSIEDTLRDDSAQDAFDEIINDMSDSQEFEALKRLIILKSQEATEKEDSNKSEIYRKTKQKLAQLQTIYDETPEKIHSMFIAQTSKMTVEQKHKLLMGTVIEEQLNRKLKENEEKKLEELSKKFATKYERTTRNIINNVAHTAVTISKRLTANEKRRFLDKNKDLFHSLNNKIVIRVDWYKGKTRQELEQIEERVRGLSREVKAGAWHSVREYKEFKKLEAEVEKLRNELINEKLKTKRKVITVSDESIIVNTSVEMPSKLKRILDNVFDKTAKTKVQEISLEDSEHITQNYYSFVENNASILNSLTNEEVEEIVNFYLSSEVLPETNKVRQYLITRLFVSTFIIKQNEAGVFNISQENIDNLTKSVENMVSIGSQLPSLFRQSLKVIRDTREMLIRGLGNEMLNITFEKDTIQNLREAVDKGDYEKLKIARKRMYDEGLEKLKKEKVSGKYNALKSLLIEKANKQKSVDGADVNKIDEKLKDDLEELKKTYKDDYKKISTLYKQTYKKSSASEKMFLSKQVMTLDRYLEKFVQFERTMMLSGPGTWVRNQVSNVLIGGLRVPTEKIGSGVTKVLAKLSPKKFKKDVKNQYKIIGVKVNEDVKKFIQKELIENDLLKLISIGLSKQASADIDYSYKVDNIVDLIKQGIKNDLRSKAQYDNKLINNMFNFIFKMMSDDKSVNKTMLQYFGKMLTEKNINLKNGMTNEVIKLLVDAYTFAASEYMHRTNLMTEFEGWLKGKNYKAYFMYKQLFPFAAASWNWFVEGLNYTPIGLAKSIIQYAKLENTIAKMEEDGKISSEFAQYATIKNIGKGVIGSIGTIIGALLAAFGVARLDEEDEQYKLFIGNTAIDISDVFGTQSILISMAIVSSIKDDENLMSVFSTALDAIFEDSTFQDTMNLFRYSDTFGDFLLYLPEKFIRAMLPNFFKQIASIINVKEVKYSTGIKGRIDRLAVQSIPGIAYLYPHYIDPYTGEEQIPYNMPILTNIINKLTPINIYPYRVSDLEKEAISLGVSKGMLTGEYTIDNNDVELNAKQRKSLNEYYAKLNKADLADLTTNKTRYKVQNEEGTYDDLYYKDMTDKQKATVIDRIMSNNSGYAKTYMLTQQMGYKYYTTNSEREKLRELGITNNIYVKNNKYNGYVK